MFERARRRLVRENRIYIMPTMRGVVFLAMVVVMILTAATYNNNLIFLLAFFLFSLFVVSMLQTNDNLRGVSLARGASAQGFAGEVIPLSFAIARARPRDAQDLRVRLRTRGTIHVVESHRADLAAADPGTTARVSVRVDRRGIYDLPEVILQTTYPHGLFRSWIVSRLPGELTIYPRPRGAETLAPANLRGGVAEAAGQTHSPEGDFGELTAYRAGESYHRIAWKHFARTGALYQKVHWGAARPHFALPWRAGDEADLEQMSKWVETALNVGATFELRGPDVEIGPGLGPELAHAAWRALARAGVKR